MSLSIIDIKPATLEKWSTIYHACSWSTYTESVDWSRLWQETFGASYTPSPVLFTYSDGVELLLPITKVVRSGKWFEVLLAGPSGGYGGPLGYLRPSALHVQLMLEKIHDSYPDFHFRLNPFLFEGDQEDLSPHTALPESLQKPIKNDFTQPVPLNEHTTELLSRKRARRYANAARKKGYCIREMTPDEIPSYLAVYAQAQQRWQETTVHYPDTLFLSMANLKGCTFYGVYDAEGTFCGGGPFLFGNNIVTTWLSFMQSNRLSDHIYELFYYELILKFKNDGYTWFDFNPSGGQSGVVRFKDKFTPYLRPAPVYEAYSWKRLFLITLGRP